MHTAVTAGLPTPTGVGDSSNVDAIKVEKRRGNSRLRRHVPATTTSQWTDKQIYGRIFHLTIPSDPGETIFGGSASMTRDVLTHHLVRFAFGTKTRTRGKQETFQVYDRS
jgi:hypothetical protein